jgi:DNA invertase Pin-like site-specific DNA recombinase
MDKAPQPVAFSYIRFSHPEQEKGDSVRRQTELRNAWLARNKVHLDTSLTLEDRGVSAFTGDHRSNPDRHALATFLELVEEGRIGKGSYLIVENLDRLSREDTIPALELFLGLIRAGVRIVQLTPSEIVYDSQSNPMTLMMAIMELNRGHSESQMKSERIGRAWKEKKRKAVESKTPVTSCGPSWLKLVDGKWEKDEPKTEVVRNIFRWTTEGYSMDAVMKKLNETKVPPFGHGRHWSRSSVRNVLKNRAVVGEYQPHVGRKQHRKPEGEPIPGYFPAILSEEEWWTAQASIASRHGMFGRPSKDKNHINLFAGRLWDARDGSTLIQRERGPHKGGRVLVSYAATQGAEGSKFVSFPFDVFEKSLLLCLHEIDPRTLYPRPNGSRDAVIALSAELEDLQRRLDDIQGRIETYTNPESLDDLLLAKRNLKAKKEDVVAKLTLAKQKATAPLDAAWGECKGLIGVLESASNKEEIRTRLRLVIRRTVEGVWCLFVRQGLLRMALVQVFFTGETRRDYAIVYRPAVGYYRHKLPASWQVASMPAVPEFASLMDLRSFYKRTDEFGKARFRILEQNMLAYLGTEHSWKFPPGWEVKMLRLFEYLDAEKLEILHPDTVFGSDWMGTGLEGP